MFVMHGDAGVKQNPCPWILKYAVTKYCMKFFALQQLLRSQNVTLFNVFGNKNFDMSFFVDEPRRHI